jgi:hypothetical protein
MPDHQGLVDDIRFCESPTAEWDEELGYDADHQDDSQYCEHGKFIGSWWGPDYLCGWCEDGISRAEMIEIHKAQRRREIQKLLDTERDLNAALSPLPWSARHLHWWVHDFAPHMLRQARIFSDEDWEVR